MAVVQVGDVPGSVVARLEARAAAHGLDLGTFLRGEFECLAAASANPEVVARQSRARRPTGPSVAETVALIRATRGAGSGLRADRAEP